MSAASSSPGSNISPSCTAGRRASACSPTTATRRRSATVPGRTDKPALLRQAPNNWNLGVTYDHGGLSMRLGVTHNDASIFEYNYQDGADGGIKGPLGDVYLYPHTQIDAQAHIQLRARAGRGGLAAEPEQRGVRLLPGQPAYQIQREFYNRTSCSACGCFDEASRRRRAHRRRRHGCRECRAWRPGGSRRRPSSPTATRALPIREYDGDQPSGPSRADCADRRRPPDVIVIGGDLPWHGGTAADYDVFRAETSVWRERHLRAAVARQPRVSQCDPGRLRGHWWTAFPELRDVGGMPQTSARRSAVLRSIR